MAISWEVDQEIYQVFIQETFQLLEQIEDILVSFNRDFNPAKIEELIRAAHTIKGGAAQIKLTDTQKIAARLEVHFRLLKKPEIDFSPELLNLLIQGYELLRLSVITPIENNGALDDDSDLLDRSESVFIQLDAILGEITVENYDNIPKIADVEPDIKELICNTEIANALDDLENILVEAPDEELLSQLQAQIAIFLDLGTILGISEFVSIAQTSQATLEASPQSARNLGQLAKVGFQAGLQAVLNQNYNNNEVSQSSPQENTNELSEADLFWADLEPKTLQDSVSEAESVILEETKSRAVPQFDEGVTEEVDPSLSVQKQKFTSLAIKEELSFDLSKSLVWQTGNNNVFILPYEIIEKNLSSKLVKFIYSEEEKYLRWQSQLLQVYQLSKLLNYQYPQTAIEQSKQNKDSSILIINYHQVVIALEVQIHRIITAKELIIKPFSNALAPPNYIYGCTILPDLPLAPAIDVPLLLGLRLDRLQTLTNSLAEVPSNNRETANKASNILVVDDSSAWREILSLALQKNGYNVIQAKDGQDAIEQLLSNSQIQLIVSDLEMPNLNGFEFLTYCRHKLLLTEMPFILLTTRSSDLYRQQAKQLGATDYFTKPYNESEFLNALQSYLR